jgi:hypothetical protein
LRPPGAAATESPLGEGKRTPPVIVSNATKPGAPDDSHPRTSPVASPALSLLPSPEGEDPQRASFLRRTATSWGGRAPEGCGSPRAPLTLGPDQGNGGPTREEPKRSDFLRDGRRVHPGHEARVQPKRRLGRGRVALQHRGAAAFSSPPAPFLIGAPFGRSPSPGVGGRIARPPLTLLLRDLVEVDVRVARACVD